MLVIDDVQSTCERGRQSLTARIQLDQQETRLWFKWNGAACPSPGDVLLLAVTQPAMRRGSDIKIHQAISGELESSMPEVQRHFQQQAPELAKISIEVALANQPSSRNEDQSPVGPMVTGVLFDGGVDAFFTYIHHQDQIQAVIYVADYFEGEEIQRGKGTAIKSAELRSRDLGKPFLKVDTNLREFLAVFNNDPRFDQALVVSIIDCLLSGHLDRLVVPGAHDQSMDDAVMASDSRLSFTSYLPYRRIYFDQPGSLVEISSKLDSLQANSNVLEALRVCWENPRRAYNCGRCRKCTRRVSPARLVELLGRESRLARNSTNLDASDT